jgi:allophanate hydrolase subunit 1
MTRVQIHFRLRQPLTGEMLAWLSDAHAIYGIQRVTVAAALDSLMVEYDATRLRPAEVEAALAGAGIAADPA